MTTSAAIRESDHTTQNSLCREKRIPFHNSQCTVYLKHCEETGFILENHDRVIWILPFFFYCFFNGEAQRCSDLAPLRDRSHVPMCVMWKTDRILLVLKARAAASTVQFNSGREQWGLWPTKCTSLCQCSSQQALCWACVYLGAFFIFLSNIYIKRACLSGAADTVVSTLGLACLQTFGIWFI